MDPAFDLSVVPFQKVKDAIDEAKNELVMTREYNTAHHSRHEITAVVPEIAHDRVTEPIGHYEDWIELIAESQGISQVHTFLLPRYLVRMLLDAYAVYYSGRDIKRPMMDEILELWPAHTSTGLTISQVFDSADWFLRLNMCSPKDSEERGSVSELEQVVCRLCTSARAATEFQIALQDVIHKPVKLFLIPWNPHMDPAREYRVFCPPPATRIAAISQYRWWSRLPVSASGTSDLETKAASILHATTGLHMKIMSHANNWSTLGRPEVEARLRRQGFVFDVLELHDGTFQLVELNNFGATTGCGSCLFHWIDDARTLYGQNEKIEFRVTQ